MLTDLQIKSLEQEDKRKYFVDSIVKVRLSEQQEWIYDRVSAISAGCWAFKEGKFYKENMIELSLDFPKSGYYNFQDDCAFFGYFPRRQFKKGLNRDWCYVVSFFQKLKGHSSPHSFIHGVASPNLWNAFFSNLEEKHNPNILLEMEKVISGKKLSSALTRDFALSQSFFGTPNEWTLWCHERACANFLPNGTLLPFTGTTFVQEIQDTFIPLGIKIKDGYAKV